MDDILNVGELGKDRVNGSLVGKIDATELGTASTDEFDPVQALLRAIGAIVDNHDLVAGLEEGEGGEGADVAEATDLVSNVGGTR